MNDLFSFFIGKGSVSQRNRNSKNTEISQFLFYNQISLLENVLESWNEINAKRVEVNL